MSQKFPVTRPNSTSRGPGTAIEYRHHSVDTLITTGVFESTPREDRHTNSPLSTVSHSDKPFASTDGNESTSTGIVAPPALRHTRSSSLPSDLPANGFVASRVNNVDTSSALTKNVNLTDARTSTIQHGNMQSWTGSAFYKEEPESGRDSRRVSLPTKNSTTQVWQPSVKDNGCNDHDRSTLPSQSKPPPATSLSRYRPGARMVFLSGRKRRPTTDDIARPLAPSATEEALHGGLPTSDVEMPDETGFVENNGPSSKQFRVIDSSTATTAPFHWGHRRDMTSILQMEELVSRDEPRKRSSYGTEAFRAMVADYVDEPTSPRNISSAMVDSELHGFSSDTITRTLALERDALTNSNSSSLTKTSGSRNGI